MVARECLFRPRKFLLQQNDIDFNIKCLQIIHQMLHKSSVYGILRTVRLNVLFLRRKTHFCLNYKNLRVSMLLLHDYVKKNGSQDLKHLQINDKNVSTS